MPNSSRLKKPNKNKSQIKDFHCYDPDCEYTFTLDWNRRCKPHCPVCGDNINVLRYPIDNRGRYTPRRTDIKRPRWQTEDLQKLNQLLQENYTQKEIAEQLGRTEAAVCLKLKEIAHGPINRNAHPS